jgi:hypothetical protein
MVARTHASKGGTPICAKNALPQRSLIVQIVARDRFELARDSLGCESPDLRRQVVSFHGADCSLNFPRVPLPGRLEH